jgi:hypothetical protein
MAAGRVLVAGLLLASVGLWCAAAAADRAQDLSFISASASEQGAIAALDDFLARGGAVERDEGG